MELLFKSRKLKYQCENPKEAQRIYGGAIGNKLTQRVNELYNALNLTDIKNIPAARMHRLQGKRADKFAVVLVHPYRLIFKPMLQEEADINDLNSITVVRIEEVTDYHGKLSRK